MKSFNIGLLLFAVGLIAGCGGSGGSSAGAPAKVTINSSNQATVANIAVSVAGQNLAGTNANFVGGVQTSTDSKNSRLLFNMADFGLQQMAQQDSLPAGVIGAVVTTSCVNGGNYSIDTDTQLASTRTYYKATYNNCVTGAITRNGTMNITNVSHTDPLTATFDFNLTTTITGAAPFTMVGGFNISAAGVGTAARTDSLSGTSIAITDGTSTFALTNFSFSSAYNPNASPIIFSNNVNYTVSVTDPSFNASFSIATTATIEHSSSDFYPRAGQVVVSGDANTALKITILASSTGHTAGTSTGQLTLETSSDGGATYTTSTTTQWSAL